MLNLPTESFHLASACTPQNCTIHRYDIYSISLASSLVKKDDINAYMSQALELLWKTRQCASFPMDIVCTCGAHVHVHVCVPHSLMYALHGCFYGFTHGACVCTLFCT